MESVPEPRPSEWDKRLSAHSPFRTLSANGQVPTGADGVSAAARGRCRHRVQPQLPLVFSYREL